MIKFLTIAAFLFTSHLLSYAATDMEDTLLGKAQLYMNLMEDAGQCGDIQTNETLRTKFYNLFSESFVKIVNGTDVLAPYQNSEGGDSDPREALLKQLIAAREAFGTWTFPNESIFLSEIPEQYKIQISARTVAKRDDVELSILKIFTFDINNKISRLDEVFLKIR